MKRQSNIFISSALIATFALVAACAPTSKSKKFKDHGGSGKGSPTEKATGIRTDRSEEAKELSKIILAIDAEVEDADTAARRQMIDTRLAEVLAGNDSAMIEIATTDKDKKNKEVVGGVAVKEDDNGDTKAGLASNKNSNRIERGAQSTERIPHIIKVLVTIDGVGTLKFAGKNTEFGTKALVPLASTDKDCATKFADLKVRAACLTSGCTQLIVQVAKKLADKPTAAHIEEALQIQSIQAQDEDSLKKLQFNAKNRTEGSVTEVAAQKAVCKEKDKAANDNEPAPKEAEGLTPESAKEEAAPNPAESSAKVKEETASDLISSIFNS